MRVVFSCVLILSLLASGEAFAQTSGDLSDAESAATSAAGSAASGGAAGGTTVNCGGGGSCLSGIGAACEECQSCLCNSAIGQLFSNMLKPMSFATGGLIEDPCAKSQQKKADQDAANSGGAGSNSAQQTAAKIKQDQAQAKARAEAVAYLATVDCHYYPEAEKAILTSLRTDRVELVRLTAAKALGSGCCCSKTGIEALKIVMTGSDKDGNPAETSPRVRAAACRSLTVCLGRVESASTGQGAPAEPIRPESPMPAPLNHGTRPLPEPIPPGAPRPAMRSGGTITSNAAATYDPAVRAVAYYEQMRDEKPTANVVSEARRAVARYEREPAPMIAATGRRNLYDLWQASAGPTTNNTQPPQQIAAPTPAPMPPVNALRGSAPGPIPRPLRR